MQRTTSSLLACSLFLLLGPGKPLLAQDTEADPVGDTTIEVEDRAADVAIRQRLEAIYAQLESLAEVQVSVQEGVVTLSGSTANEAQARRAVELAARLEGIVTVEDNIERALDVQSNVVPILDSLRADARQLLRSAPLLLVALTLFVLIAWLGGLLARWNSLWRRVTPNAFLAELVGQAVRIVAIVFGLVLALKVLGASALIATILGGAGVLGLAIGFAVRDTMENYISSIMLSLRQPFRANEHVVINEHEGKVVKLTSRATVLMTLDGNHLRIPNSTVFKSVILNYTRNPERRFDFELGVDANDDPIAAINTGVAAIASVESVLDDPKPSAVVKAVGDSNIVILFMGWVNQEDSDFGKVRSLAIRAATTALERDGFSLPEPIYRLRLDERSARLAGALDGAVPSAEGEPGRDGELQPPAEAAGLDVSPDTHLEELVNDERAQSGETDLLDSDKPVE